MTLTNAQLNRSYRILQIQGAEDSAVAIRFRQLGFISGIELKCEALAPLLKYPMLVRIRGMQVALARTEAELVEIEELPR